MSIASSSPSGSDGCRFLHKSILLLMAALVLMGAFCAGCRSRRTIKKAEKLYQRGVSYCDGEEAPVDYAMAADLFRQAAELGNADAQAQLGGCYLSGMGVKFDLESAEKWLRKAAKRGNPYGCMWLADLLWGHGDYQEILALRRQAVDGWRQLAEDGDCG